MKIVLTVARVTPPVCAATLTPRSRKGGPVFLSETLTRMMGREESVLS